jgi:hypothetical protein
LKVLFFIFFGVLFYNFSFAGCALDLAPLKDRVKNADAIFIGVVLSDGGVASATDYDREAMVKVKRVFKGELDDRAIIQYKLSTAGSCDNSQLWPLSFEKGEDILFYANKKNDRFFSSIEMGVSFTNDYNTKMDIAELPAVVQKLSRPWWDFFGWVK